MKKLFLIVVLMFTLALISFSGTYAADNLSGKVVETLDSGGYTYVNIEKDGNKTWVAIPQSKITVGKEMSFKPGSVMTDFTSKSLNRTFDTIIFSGGVEGKAETSSVEKKEAVKSPIKVSKVKKAEGPDSYTVAELYEKQSDLDKKVIVLSGTVVKFSAQIMGKNWAHLQDGSGDASKGTNDMLLTLQETLAIGDTVTLQGTLSKDKDFGSGYKYAVIIEDATVKK
jgi:hypothetical protein